VKRLQDHIVDTLPGSVLDWQPPIPLGPFYGPPFPLDALSPWHRAFVEGVATSTQTPPDMAAWASLAAVGAATRGRYVVSPKADWKEPVHIQSLQVLASGGGKSPVYQHVMRPIHRIETQWHQEWEGEHDLWEMKKKALESAERKARRDTDKSHASPDSAAALEAVQMELVKHERAEPVLKRLTADDATAEALWHVLDRQGGAIAVMSPEGGFLANITGRYSDAPIFEPVLKGYSGDPHTIDRKTENEHRRIPRAIIALSLSLQPKVIENMGTIPGFQTMGVSARLIMAFPQPIAWPDLDAPPPADEVLEWWESVITGIATDATGSTYAPNVLALSPEAQRAFRAEREWWRDSSAGGLFADMDEWGRKYPGMVLRIAGLLHIIDVSSPAKAPIPGTTMSHAIAIMRPAIDHARLGHAVMYGAGGQDAAHNVLEVLLTLRDEAGGIGATITSAMVYDRLRGRQAFQKAEAVIAVLRSLEERRYIILIRRDGPGPQTYSVFLNPLYIPAKMRSYPVSGPSGGEMAPISQLRSQSGEIPESEPLAPTGTDDTWSMDL
jgi:hypothetical protein